MVIWCCNCLWNFFTSFNPETLEASKLKETLNWIKSAFEVLIIPVSIAATIGQIAQMYLDKQTRKEYERLFIEKALILKKEERLNQNLIKNLENILK